MKLSTYENLRVSNFSVHALCRVLEEAGLDWRSALLRAELSPDAAERLGGTVPGRKELAFQMEFAALTEDRPDLWPRAAKRYTPSGFGVRSLALLSAPTIQAYLEVTIDATDVGPAVLDVTPLRTDEGIMQGIALTYPNVPKELLPFSFYREFSFITRTLPWMYGGPFPFTRIEFPLESIALEAAALVPCPVSCGAQTFRMWWEPEAAMRPLPFGNAFQHATFLQKDTQVLDTLRASGDWPAVVARTVRSAPELNRKLENTAASLGISPRTLQRRLAYSGTDFGSIRDKTLNALAVEMLQQTNRSLASISRTLGYSDPAGFSLAFKRWNGVPPSTYRAAGPPSDRGARRARTSSYTDSIR